LPERRGKDTALSFIEDLMQFLYIASVDRNTILNALHSGISDFEDGIQVCSAKQEGINTIITRNEKDFYQNSGLNIQSPKAFFTNIA